MPLVVFFITLFSFLAVSSTKDKKYNGHLILIVISGIILLILSFMK
jgi:hypothetical protein